jgi:hypothetical protein
LLWCSPAVIAVATLYFAGVASYPAKAQKRPRPETTTPQTLPFSQNWSNAGLITANDDWSGVPGITGYLGNYDTVAAPTNVDPRTLLTPFVTNDIDVIANQTMVSLTNGGVAEFDGIADPVVALNGSGTADAPHIIVYLNTTGVSGINFACNIRDIDDTIDSSAQQVDVQYRVGGTGNYISVAGGYIADATSGPSTTMTTPLNLALPAAVDNQAMVEIRIMTTNAGGNDEWVGVDDINVTAAPAVNNQHVVDFNGDGKTDWVTVRNTGGGPGGQETWFVQENTGIGGGVGPSYQFPWGQNGDFYVPEDYDGDGKTDFAVWRPGPAGAAAWYVLNSIGSTVRAENYGQTGDDPTVVGDYNNDNKADLAVYRAGAAAGDPSFWFYRVTANGPVFARQWGQNGDFPAPGDYDGDGSADFVVQRSVGFAGQGAFWMNYAAVAPGTLSRYVQFGTATDIIVPGDYNGDGKTDLAITRGSAGSILWFIEPSDALGTFTQTNWGLSASDFRTQGDYDGDGTTDIAVWRPNADPTQNYFFVRRSSNGNFFANEWGQNGDYPVANYNQH